MIKVNVCEGLDLPPPVKLAAKVVFPGPPLTQLSLNCFPRGKNLVLIATISLYHLEVNISLNLDPRVSS